MIIIYYMFVYCYPSMMSSSLRHIWLNTQRSTTSIVMCVIIHISCLKVFAYWVLFEFSWVVVAMKHVYAPWFQYSSLYELWILVVNRLLFIALTLWRTVLSVVLIQYKQLTYVNRQWKFIHLFLFVGFDHNIF